jgi:hypothetical protein
MSWTKFPSSQYAHYDAAASILQVRGRTFGILVVNSTVVELLEFDTKRWWTLPALPSPIQAFGMASLGDQVIVVGGMQQAQQLATAHSFSFGKSAWEPLPNLSTPRCYPAAVGLPDIRVLLVLGGRDETWQELNTVEGYSFERKEWKTLASCEIPRMAPAAVAMESSKVFLIGGYNGTEWTASVETYDAQDNTWSSNEVAPLPIRVAFPKAVQIQQPSAIIVLGTSVVQDVDEDSYTIIQSYNLEDKQWKVLLSAPQKNSVVPREGCCFTSVESTLYTIGGRAEDDNQASKQVLQWNVTNLEPTIIDSNAPHQAGDSVSGSMGSHGSSQAIPPTVNVRAQFSLADLESMNSGDSRRSLAQSTISAISQLPSRVAREQEEDVPKHTLTSPMLYKDFGTQEGRYLGQVATSSNRPHGKGQITWEYTGDIYDGEWRHGNQHGHGRIKYATGDVFEGSFKNDLKHGRGTYQWKDGRQYDGLYVNDRSEDPNGTLTWKNGTLFVGQFARGQRSGKGVIRFPNNVRYQGDFLNGKYNGFGTCTFQDGRVYTGYWKRGKAHGKGKLTEADGTVLHDGDWSHDVPVIQNRS